MGVLRYTQEVEQERGFFGSFEVYFRRVVGKSTLPYLWAAIGMVALVLGVSLWQGKYSLSGATNMSQVVQRAAQNGDYALAQRLYGQCAVPQCQSVTDLVYPEKKIDQRIADLEGKLTQYPGDRDIYLALARLYAVRGNTAQAQSYSEQARILAPNN